MNMQAQGSINRVIQLVRLVVHIHRVISLIPFAALATCRTKVWSNALQCILTNERTYSNGHSVIHSFINSVTHPSTRSLTQFIAQQLSLVQPSHSRAQPLYYPRTHSVTHSSLTTAKDMINMLLVLDPKKRWTAEQALNHDWITDRNVLCVQKRRWATRVQKRSWVTRRVSVGSFSR